MRTLLGVALKCVLRENFRMKKLDNTLRDPRILRCLQYFEAVARHGSVVAAAQEASVSPSAVSHQLRTLSTFLGEELLVKSGRGIKLTETGRKLYQEISIIFSSVSDVLEGVVGKKKEVLRVAVCSSFGPSWLAEKISHFQDANPEIDLELRLYAQDPYQTENVADVIVTASPTSLGFESIDLFEECLVAVASPQFSKKHNESQVRLITTDVPPSPVGSDWQSFLSKCSIKYALPPEHTFLRCTHYVLALALAKADMGAALIPNFLAEAAIMNGEVVKLSDNSMPSGRTYRVCYKVSRAKDLELKKFTTWLKKEAALDEKTK